MKWVGRIVGAIFLIVAIAIPFSYFLARSGMVELDQAERDRVGGAYLQTKYGALSYTRDGPLDAPAVILVHGFSTPKFVWNYVKPQLLAEGHQVITFDHLGRGFSERPEVAFNADLYRDEIASVIEQLELQTPVTLVGYSMGGANVVDYAATYPDQVSNLVLIAPAGYFGGSAPDWLIAPMIGEWFANVVMAPMTAQGIKREVDSGRAPQDMLDNFTQQANYLGFAESLMSTIRHYPMGQMQERYQVIGKIDIPVTAIWGTADEVVPFANADDMSEDVPQLVLIPLEEVNHSLTYGRPDLVGPELAKALAGN